MFLTEMGVKKQLIIMALIAMVALGATMGLNMFQSAVVYDKVNFANINTIPSLNILSEIGRENLRNRVYIWQHIASDSDDKKIAIEQKILVSRESIRNLLTKYDELTLDNNDRELITSFKSGLEDYIVLQTRALSFSNKNKEQEARDTLLSPQAVQVLENNTKAIDETIKYNLQASLKQAKIVTETQQNTFWMQIIIFFAVLVIIFTLIAFIIKNIMRQLGAEPKDVVDIVNQIAQGKTDVGITLQQGDTVSLLSNMKKLADTLNNLIIDSDMMNTEALKGNLDAQIDASKYQGDFGKISVGINGFVAQVRNYRQGNDEQNWVKDGTSSLNEVINQSTGIRNLASNAMNLIARYSQSGVGGLYLVDSMKEKANLYASYAYTERSALSNEFEFGHGIIGQVALEKKAILLKNIKNNDLVISSGTTESSPQNIYAYPLVYQDELVGIIELGSYDPFTPLHLQYFNDTVVPLAASLLAMKSKEETQSLYLQANSFADELRDKNSELLEQQQTLERQTQELEISQQETLEQNKEMEIQNTILIQSRIDLDKRTADLEESNRYKSQFLANMSHELRTPLNSVMLLSKTLSKNKKENLDDDQVKQLSVIHQAGDELLHLINDILDLSKIEARLMTLSVGEIPVSTLLDSVYDMFKPMADEKNIHLSVVIDENTPKFIVSDKEKIRQIIKNFVSNAIKFTPANGTITMNAQRDLQHSALPIRLSVIDSGIGIPSEKHKLVFEAFKQADGGTSRKYGGTGLGLSISKELGNLLGGEVTLKSEVNKGSTFAVNLPEKMDTRSINPDLLETVSHFDEHLECLPKILVEISQDDRIGLTLLEESILIVEDDTVYSNILLQKVNELGYKGIVAGTGFEAISMANKYQPHAILLDINLPDFDGWEVLRLLKNDTNTRHIPVKIISADEPNLLAKRMGAVNFIQKPTDEDEISEIIQSIMMLSKNKYKSILVVEDDPIQRDHIVSVLQGDNIEIVAVEDVRSALNHDMSKHFDCAIIDLNLPGESGFTLLNILRKKMCPVPIIVFTARDLTLDEIVQLREYEATVILKTANSYERLLEEVSIFIHRGKEGFSVDSQKLFSAGKDSNLNGKNILVVDDDFRNIFALSSVLEQEGLNIFTAVNGAEGIHVLENNSSIDLVLMDMMMPVMDGYEAMKKIRSNPKYSNLPIIALTAKAQKEDHDLCIKSGANDYLSKPLDHEKLLLLMKLWLNNSCKKSV